MNPKIRTIRLAMLPAILLLSHLAAATAGAQTPDTTEWVKFAPADDNFTVLMPQSPVVTTQKKKLDKSSVDVRLYTVTTQHKAIYTVWSLSGLDKDNLIAEEAEDYLDSCMELVLDEVNKAKPAVAGDGFVVGYGMTYVEEVPRAIGYLGRVYRIYQGNKLGIAFIYYASPRVYIVTAMKVKPEETGEARKFVDSFAITVPPSFMPNTDSSISPLAAQLGPKDTYPSREVTQRARILARPEPQYTEEARKFHVRGTVVLRAVFSSNGQVTDLKVINRLPHGLTRTSVEAARRIKFQPAVKDGRAVSQYIQIEYNYNLY